MRATALIFDMDGVLLDTEPLYTEATLAVVAPFGKTYDWSLKADVMGRAATVSARIVVERLALPLTPEEFLARRAVALEPLFARVPEVPGAGEFVAALSRHGKKLGVATSSGRRLFALKSAPHSWFSHFGAIVCGDDPEVARPKPAPDIFLAAAARLGCTPSDCVVIEDSPSGVEAAVAAGMRVVALRDREVGEERFRGAERIVTSYAELDAAAL